MTHKVHWEQYDDLLHLIYASAIEPHRLPEALAMIADLWQVSKAILYSFSIPDGRVIFNIGHNISARGLQTYAARTASQDPFVEMAYRLDMANEGVVTIGESHISREDILKTDFYREVWLPENIGQTCYAVVFDGTDSKKAPVVLSLMRSLDEPSFTEVDRQMLQRMLNHLSRAMGAMFHLRIRDLKIAASNAALDALHAGVVLLDAGQHICFKNVAAKKLLFEKQVIGAKVKSVKSKVAGECLVLSAAYAHLQRKFDRFIDAASWSNIQADANHFSEAFIVEDNMSGKPICVIHAVPIVFPEREMNEGGGKNVIVFLYDLSSILIEPQRLEHLYGLTRGESIASLEILNGGTVAQMAHRIGISENTFKTQLKTAFDKTHTHRQVDFLKLLLALAIA